MTLIDILIITDHEHENEGSDDDENSISSLKALVSGLGDKYYSEEVVKRLKDANIKFGR